jgi:hypothetical protein
MIARGGAAGAVALAVLVSCSHPRSDLRLDNPFDSAGGGGAVPDVRTDRSYMYLLPPLCSAGGPVRITSVTPHRLDGRLTVVDWAAVERTALTYADGVPGTAHDLLGPAATDTVSWKCYLRNHDHSSAFAIGIKLRSAQAVADGWDVHSTSGTVYVPFLIKECVGAVCPYPTD